MTEEVKQPQPTQKIVEAVKPEDTLEVGQAPDQVNNTGQTGPKNIDWVAAKQYYLESFSRSYNDVARKFGVALTNVEKKGSEEKWVKCRREMGEKALQEFEENKILEIANANRNHIVIFRSIQAHASRKLFNSVNLKPSEIKSLADSLKVGIEGERLVLGLPTTVSKSEIMGKLQTDLQLSPEQIAKMDTFFKNETSK